MMFWFDFAATMPLHVGGATKATLALCVQYGDDLGSIIVAVPVNL